MSKVFHWLVYFNGWMFVVVFFPFPTFNWSCVVRMVDACNFQILISFSHSPSLLLNEIEYAYGNWNIWNDGLTVENIKK